MASKLDSGEASARGLIRDSEGQWVVRFTLNLGHCNNMVVELDAIRFGLSLASDWLEKGALFDDCHWLMARKWCCKLLYIFTEGNACADALAY
ncbi:uncharacterized protein A4U43_UnF10390 [Asparagus officinalis]|uniref:RNase H type-1 domain-containing protein n=1 Tax=Asparagus officinalis TaxID=4686 RepID=A0A1R3L5G7_ASPOF|nr:uncharacterized protein A4U43_UnF10390 [Asparagus officinalis]